MNFTFTENDRYTIKPKTIDVQPGDVCKLINRKGEHNAFIVVHINDVRYKCELCDLRNTNYMPHRCAYYDFRCIGRMAFKSLDRALEDL